MGPDVMLASQIEAYVQFREFERTELKRVADERAARQLKRRRFARHVRRLKLLAARPARVVTSLES